MKIAGIYPQKLQFDSKIQHAVSEPYGLEIILAIAAEEGHDVELFLPAKEEDNKVVPINEEEFIERIVKFNPDMAAFSMYTCQYPMGKRIASELKRRLPGILIIAGNRYPSVLGDSIEDPFDFFVIKEGELTFRDFLREMKNGQIYENVKGISYRKNGKNISTGSRERNLDLDSLPNAMRFPVILKQIYRGVSLPPLSSSPHHAIVEYSRCCYNDCKFCDNSGFWGNRVVFRSPKKVVKEMFELKERGVDIFYFIDLNFTAYPEKARKLCDEMIKQKLDISWHCMSNIATAEWEPDILDLMKKAGCYKIAWGVESTCDSSLERMNKKVGDELTKNEQTIRVLRKSLEAGLINQGFYIVGFPWETEKTILRDAQSLKKMPLHILNIGIFTPIPFSIFHKEMSDEYTFDKDLEKHDRNTLMYNHKTLSNELVKALQKKIYDDFYNSREYLERLKETCRIDDRFRKAFNDYFEFLGKEVRV